ncbi:MAG: preprotein translocase subunit SecE [Planctomycetes bacterium]|nr:preprotein translocase subunit SecE [Planctomycetota bacterium]
MAYKQDQGRYARLAAFWSLAILIFYGCTSLYTTLLGYFPNVMAKPLVAGMPKVPVLGVPLNPGMLIAAAVLGLSVWFLYRLLERPKQADALIETESELRKVTWPTVPEAVRSSVVVIACVLFIMAYLAGADWLLGRWAERLLLGG